MEGGFPMQIHTRYSISGQLDLNVTWDVFIDTVGYVAELMPWGSGDFSASLVEPVVDGLHLNTE